MKSKIIVTNIRVPEYQWLQMKAVAAEKGISANEYLNQMIKHAVQMSTARVKKKKRSIWDLAELAKIPNHSAGTDELSKEDTAIYES